MPAWPPAEGRRASPSSSSIRCQSSGNCGIVLAVVPMSSISTPVDRETDERAGRGKTVVVVRAPAAAVQLARHDADAVLELVSLAAEAAQLADERGDAVGLVAADVPDAVDRGRAFGERGEREDRGGQLAGGGEVEIDALDAVRTGGDGERAAAADDLRAHERQDVGQHRARLRGVGRPSGHRRRIRPRSWRRRGTAPRWTGRARSRRPCRGSRPPGRSTRRRAGRSTCTPRWASASTVMSM